VDVHALDDSGKSVIDELGELVILQPMPSMPLFIWGDQNGDQYRDAYFTVFPDVWRHGDWLRLTRYGSAIIEGRSDATINRRGVRIGSSEIYRVVDRVPGVVESLVVDALLADGNGYMPLFVTLAEGTELTEELKRTVADQIRTELSPRFVPDDILQIAEVPRTLTGKKLEVPVKRILQGEPVELVVSRDAIANPDALDCFVDVCLTGIPPRT
jgi:acetoacetyl-CoA synthetase